MNTLEINDALKTIDHFVGTFSRDRVPIVTKRPCSYVINMDDANDDGSHWIACYVGKDGEGVYFDSYGRPPPLHSDDIMRLLTTLTKRWNYNDKCLQGLYSYVCGHYCILFLLLVGEGVTMEAFSNLFTANTKNNDTVVKMLVNKYTKLLSKKLYK